MKKIFSAIYTVTLDPHMLISTAVSQIVRSPALGWISTLLLSFSPHCAFLVSSGAALAGGLAGAFRFLGLVADAVAALQNRPAAIAPASGATQNTEMCCVRLWPCMHVSRQS